MIPLSHFDNPESPASERLNALASTLSNAVNAGEITGDPGTLVLSAAFVMRHVRSEVMRLEGLERRLNQMAEDARLDVLEEAMEVVHRFERQACAEWSANARRGCVTVYHGKREQIPTEQWADNSALGGY